jgi:hypothetical protein
MLRYRHLPPLICALTLAVTSQSAFSQAIVSNLNSGDAALSSTASATQHFSAIEINLHQFVAESWDHVRTLKPFSVFAHSLASSDAAKKPRYFNSLTDWKLWNNRTHTRNLGTMPQSVDSMDESADAMHEVDKSHAAHATDLQLAWEGSESHSTDAPHGLVMHNGHVSVVAAFGDGDKARATMKTMCTAESDTYCDTASLNQPVLAQNIDGGFNNQHWYQSVNLGIGYRFR